MNIAIISPNQNAYSETFIQAHKNLLDGNVFYYFNGSLPTELEGFGRLNALAYKLIYKLIGKLKGDWMLDEKVAVKRSLKKNKIDVVLAEYGTTGMKMLPFCQQLKIPLIVHFHGFDASVHSVIKEHDNYRAIFDYASKIIVVSEKMKRMLLDIGCPENKLQLSTYGPNDDYTEIKKTHQDELLFGVGRLVDKKAPYYTILAFSKIAKEFPNARLVIGGDGILKNTCNNLISYLGLTQQISLAGVLTKNQIINNITKARAFVQHSITSDTGDMEGTPLAVLEASAAGLPVISTYHAGIPDVIINGETGLLCEEHDVDAMADAMRKVLSDKEYAREMGQKGNAYIKANFTMKHHIDTLNKVIREAV